ncbi:MAG: hypothetical protein AAFY71_01010 [Bacteroidota bacterium]
MKKVITIISLFLLLIPGLMAQTVKKSSATYQINLTRSNFSEEQACQKCIELAMIEAIEKQFGRVIVQGNSTMIENINTGENVETTQIFNMIAETYVNGEWVETIDESCERFIYEEEFWLKCSVKGKVQELEQPKIDLTFKSLKCEQLECASEDFSDGEDFFMYLKSPIDGYVTIYIGDAETTQRILPYAEMPDGMMNAVEVKADKEYILFSKDKDELGLKYFVDEYQLYTEDEVDQNRVYVIFSKEPLVKPALYESEVKEYDMPMQLQAENFQKWMAKQKKYNPEMEVFRLDVTIKK